MDISGLGSDYLNAYTSLSNTSSVNSSSDITADEVTSELNSISSDSSDEELMEACKSFESYMLEQVFKNMKESVESINGEDSSDNNDYMQMFGDNLYEEYANQAVENSSLGIAQMLFDSIKRGQ